MDAQYRPHWHFTPRKGWINDPNGLVFDGKRYHLFAQHNPDDIVWGPMHWLHAVSDDMLTWRETGIALYPDALGTVFSGSAVTLPDGRIAAIYTAHGESEQQCVAFSADGETFARCPSNPVIANTALPDFRDPKVFRFSGDEKWHLVLAAGDRVHFYASPDLISWEKTGEFGATENRYGDIFECPDLFPLTAPDGSTCWVLTASMIFAGGTAKGRMQLFLGEFDGRAFRQTLPHAPLRVDEGYDCYAGASFFGTAERTFMAWLGGASAPLPPRSFCGYLTLPRRLSLRATSRGWRLASAPVLPALHPVSQPTLPDGPLVIQTRAEGPFSLTLRQGNACLVIGLNEQGWFTQRAASAMFAPDSAYNDASHRLTSAPRFANGQPALQVVWDGPVVEIFGDEGLYAHALLFFAEDAPRSIDSTAEIEILA